MVVPDTDGVTKATGEQNNEYDDELLANRSS